MTVYDAIATILGLGQLSAADGRLRQEAKALEDADKAAKAELPGLKEALYELEDDERAVQALVAVDTAGTCDFETVEALVAGLPADGNEGLLARLRAEVEQGSNPAAVMASSGKSLFWKEKDEIGRQLGRWRADLLAKAMSRLVEAERQVKAAGGIGPLAADEELFAICRQAARLR